MGFLLGAYGKLAAGSRYRSLQARMMRIQSKIRRATRDVANMEKMIDRRQKMMEQELTLNNNMSKQMYQNMMVGSMQASKEYTDAMAIIAKGQSTDEAIRKTVSSDQLSAASQTLARLQSTSSQQISSMNSYADTNTALMKSQIENEIEYMRDTLLEPLKDEEDSLQLEKDTLESQIQVAKADYEACQKMEQADVKMLTPNYTGGQG
ncbi:hypothetical protein IJ674_04230 [bacterium]|nr:hypothetical protein [bacterium]